MCAPPNRWGCDLLARRVGNSPTLGAFPEARIRTLWGVVLIHLVHTIIHGITNTNGQPIARNQGEFACWVITLTILLGIIRVIVKLLSAGTWTGQLVIRSVSGCRVGRVQVLYYRNLTHQWVSQKILPISKVQCLEADAYYAN